MPELLELEALETRLMIEHIESVRPFVHGPEHTIALIVIQDVRQFLFIDQSFKSYLSKRLLIVNC